jgi:hypothetical protein
VSGSTWWTRRFFFERQANLAQSAVGREGLGPMDRFQFRAERLSTISYDRMLKTKVAFGTAAGLIDRLTQLQEELGLSGIVAELNPGGRLPLAQVKKSLDILTREVIPAFK